MCSYERGIVMDIGLILNLTDSQFETLMTWIKTQTTIESISKNLKEKSVLTRSIDVHDFPTRIVTIFRNEKIKTYLDLVRYNEYHALQWKNMGKLSLEIIKNHLSKLGLRLGMIN